MKKKLKGNLLTKDLIFEAEIEESPFNNAILDTLKGKEIELPSGYNFADKDGNFRKHIRIKWWLNPKETSYHDISFVAIDNLPKEKIDLQKVSGFNPDNLKLAENFYNENEKPVFFGHYWLNGAPMLFRNNICCLDYSVAKNGFLACYRYDGEQELTTEKFVYV